MHERYVWDVRRALRATTLNNRIFNELFSVLMTVFKGCIDLHDGQVKQIVGGSLTDSGAQLKTNFVSKHDPQFYVSLYKTFNVVGTHVIKLGPNCDEAAKLALQSWPQGLQIGGGINADNAKQWIVAGADKVIVTSYLFPEAKFSLDRLKQLVGIVGKEHLVVDLSCRKSESQWVVAMNKWQTLTDMVLCKETFNLLSEYCSEFLIHAADVEGLCNGIDEQLVEKLGEWVQLPCVYAGGAKSIEDLQLVENLSGGKVDLTFGSALDIFGGTKVKLDDCIHWNATRRE